MKILKSLSHTQKRLLAMLCAVLVMGGALVLLIVAENREKAENAIDLSEDEDDINAPVGDYNDMLINRGSDELERLVLTNPEGTFTIQRGDDGQLEIAELAGIPLNTDFLKLAWYSAISVGYSTTVTLPEDGSVTAADYGLDDPQTTVRCSYYDGTETGLNIGSHLHNDEDSYYFQLCGSSTIYVSTFDVSLFQGSKYWISDSIFTDDYSGDAEITRIEADFHNGTVPMVLQPHTPGDRSDPYFNYKYVISGPEVCAADDYTATELVDELLWLTAYEALVPYPTSADIAAYGLDRPFVTVTVTRSGEIHRLSLTRYDYSVLYAMCDDIPVIYQLDAESYPVLADISLRTLRSTDVHVRNFNAIESFTVEYGGKSLTFSIKRVPMNGGDGLYEYYAYCGEQELLLTNYKAMLEIFNRASSIDSFTGTVTGEPYLTVTIRYFDGMSLTRETITYTECGARQYVCRINGSGSAIVTAMWVQELIDAVQQLAGGQNVTA